MRGPTGPMGLTGRPGPLVCIFIDATLLFRLNIAVYCLHILIHVHLRVLLVYQD